MATGSDRSALEFLASSAIQDEIDTLFSFGQASNLDAERQIAQTRHQEHDRVLSLAAASRNSIISRYNVARRRKRHLGDLEKQAARRKRFMNPRALALHKNPAFVQVDGAGPRPRLVIDEEALSEYLETHKDELEIEISKGRRDLEIAESQQHLPYSWSEWSQRLQDNGEFMATALREVRMLDGQPTHPSLKNVVASFCAKGFAKKCCIVAPDDFKNLCIGRPI